MITSPEILPNEKELFALLSTGDQTAFTRIFDYYGPRIYPFVLSMTRSKDSAEEIVQELFIKLWTNRATAGEIDHPRSYIFRMASNRTISYLKTQARNIRLVEKATGGMLVEKNTTEETIDYRETEEIINKLVDQLPAQQKKVYHLSRQEGLSYEEIAERLNISRNTVRNHLAEALKSIKEKLQNLPGTAIALIVFLVKGVR